MTDSDLRELDGWIAEKFMGWEPVQYADPPAWIATDKRIITWDSTSFSDAFRPSTLPAAFALVKREIERRGWDWEVMSSGGVPSDNRFKFVIALLAHSRVSVKIAEADSEELAGCLAVKAAVEGR